MHDESGTIEQLRARGYRITPQRQFILGTLCHLGGHATAGQLFERARQQMPGINQATVYRVLDFFCRANVVAKTVLGSSTVYEVIGDTPHHHLVCRSCGKTEQLDHQHLTALTEHLLQTYGFQAEINHLAIRGLCAECALQGDNS
ncbi:MAG: Fur family transcriptional regulator [Anaerolineae bacterium]